MNNPGLKITRFSHEEPSHLRMVIEASNGNLGGRLEYYCSTKDLHDLGGKMSRFSGEDHEKIIYNLGSEKPEDNVGFFFGVEIADLDSTGHCAMELKMNNNQPFPDTEICEFCIFADPADVNQLGHLFLEFAKLEHRVLKWSVKEGKLLEEFYD